MNSCPEQVKTALPTFLILSLIFLSPFSALFRRKVRIEIDRATGLLHSLLSTSPSHHGCVQGVCLLSPCTDSTLPGMISG